ncbi:MAG: MFS transporter [Phycisphaeraceae bacterium]|nr:MFS transporter [Phycisphaeraceae bacterium]
MLTRFCLYGLLKNQRYFEPVFLLALLGKGLDFGVIGSLVALRELVVMLLEIPSGAIADVLGRRGSLIASIAAYIASFAVFALSDKVWTLGVAMACYGVGEAFRSGTHKALIFRWLEIHGRTAEKTRVYGVTRSWSKYGSAIAVVLTGVLLGAGASYDLIFAVTIIPYSLLLVNIALYPRSLESPANQNRGAASRAESIRRVGAHTLGTLRDAVRRRGTALLLLNSMGFEGIFHAVKDYLQPVLAAIALAHLSRGALGDEQALALVLTPVYFTLYLLAGVSSRFSHRVAQRAGDERAGMRMLWAGFGLCFAALLLPSPIAASAAFIALSVLQNLWRPMLIARLDDEGEESSGATLLSIESQSRRFATMLAAPVIGFAVQHASEPDGPVRLWPIGAIGVALAALALGAGLLGQRRRGFTDP